MTAVDLDGLMREALRCGVTIAEYWSMTPPETLAVIEAHNWRQRQEERRQMTTAWMTAALTRTRRLPRLGALLARSKRPQKLSKNDLAARRTEFRQAATPEKLARINEAIARRNEQSIR